ncbi:hypothetical protein FQN57_007286 [Myotisia sp. PD_48]|nr:hypothetical protein FQN57_007286 [Myotisia sp. PD_48]
MWKIVQKPRDGPKHTGQVVTESDKLRALSTPDYPGQAASGLLPPPPPKEAIFETSSPERGSKPRVPSSVYSKRDSIAHSPAMNQLRIETPANISGYRSFYRDSEYTDASPPVSPLRENFDDSKDNPEISPVDDGPGPAVKAFQQANGFASPLPISNNRPEMQMHTSRNFVEQTQPPTGRDRKTKWDDYSGEPTTGDRGKFAQASPGYLKAEEHAKPKPAHKSQFSFLRGKEPKDTRKTLQKGRRPNETHDPAHTASPPPTPWKGSTRFAVLQPKEKPKVNIPPRVDSHTLKSHPKLPDTIPPTTAPIVVSKLRNNNKQLPDEPTIKPVVPLKDSTSRIVTPTRSMSSQSPAHIGNPEILHDQLSWTISNVDSNPALPIKHTHDVTPKGSDPSSSDAADKLQDLGLFQPLVSRFSTTTYATTDAGSPPSSPDPVSADNNAPPVPDISARMQALSAKGSALRKPTPSQIDESTRKTLPRSPPEMKAGNRIDEMEAKLKDLSRRKANVGTIINELTQVIQPSSVAYDLATKSEVNKTVQSLNNELADIKKDEHDIGLKLLRAYKKRDESDIYESGSGLWIKRVTS